VLATDGDTTLVKHNLERNAHSLTNISFAECEWKQHSEVGKKRVFERCDLIVASDVIYNQGREVMRQLLLACREFCKEKKGNKNNWIFFFFFFVSFQMEKLAF
jgi:hypothetical protein